MRPSHWGQEGLARAKCTAIVRLGRTLRLPLLSSPRSPEWKLLLGWLQALFTRHLLASSLESCTMAGQQGKADKAAGLAVDTVGRAGHVWHDCPVQDTEMSVCPVASWQVLSRPDWPKTIPWISDFASLPLFCFCFSFLLPVANAPAGWAFTSCFTASSSSFSAYGRFLEEFGSFFHVVASPER